MYLRSTLYFGWPQQQNAISKFEFSVKIADGMWILILKCSLLSVIRVFKRSRSGNPHFKIRRFYFADSLWNLKKAHDRSTPTYWTLRKGDVFHALTCLFTRFSPLSSLQFYSRTFQNE